MQLVERSSFINIGIFACKESGVRLDPKEEGEVFWALIAIFSALLPLTGTYFVLIAYLGLKLSSLWAVIGLMQDVVPIVAGPFLLLFLAWFATRIEFLRRRMNSALIGYLCVVAISLYLYISISLLYLRSTTLL
jgi:hypothetical protein